jgi:hypothetical protein
MYLYKYRTRQVGVITSVLVHVVPGTVIPEILYQKIQDTVRRIHVSTPTINSCCWGNASSSKLLYKYQVQVVPRIVPSLDIEVMQDVSSLLLYFTI